MVLEFETPSLVLIAGPSGAGKSSLARRLFSAQDLQVLDAEAARALICDDPKDRSSEITAALNDTLRYIARRRLHDGRRATIVDAPSLLIRDRAAWVKLARELGVPAHLLLLDATREECASGLAARGLGIPDRVLDSQLQQLAEAKASLAETGEGFASVHILTRKAAEEVERVSFVQSTRKRLDVIGDVHGCASELKSLLAELGYAVDEQGTYRHPDERLAVFVGDLIDHGPASLETLTLADRMVRAGSAVMGALGNHDLKLYRALVEKRPVMMSDALQTTLDEIDRAEAVSPGARQRVVATVSRLFAHAPVHSLFDAGQLVVTHGAIEKGTEGRRTSSNRRDPISMTNVFGQHTDEREADGRPVRSFLWADSWPAEHTVVFGHDILGGRPSLLGAGNVVSLDTGCAYGGRLTALRWPEREVVSVGAIRNYTSSSEPALDGSAPDPLGVERYGLSELRQRTQLRAVPDAMSA